MSADALLAEWSRLWLIAKAINRSRDIQNDATREPFELAAAALVYQRRAIDALTAHGALHELTRLSGGGHKDLFAIDPAQVSRVRKPRLVLGQMDLASASLRLPTAIERTLFVDPAGAGDFLGVLKKRSSGPSHHDELHRKALTSFWGKTDRLQCCQTGRAVTTLPAAATVVLLQRDDYAHGELGTDDRKWNKTRKEHTELLYRCRIVQAQQTLIRWILKRLGHGVQIWLALRAC